MPDVVIDTDVASLLQKHLAPGSRLAVFDTKRIATGDGYRLGSLGVEMGASAKPLRIGSPTAREDVGRRRRRLLASGLLSGSVLAAGVGFSPETAGAAWPDTSSGPPPTAYIANYKASSVTPIDSATGTPGTAIKVGSEPGAVSITPNGATAFVANFGSGTVTPITIATGKAGTAINVGSGPDAIAITPNGSLAYVANRGSNSVTPIDCVAHKAEKTITVGSEPEAVGITPNGATAYVANFGSGTVTPITIATGKAGTAIKVGSGPAAIAVTPNGTTVYVVNESSGTVTPINVSTNKADAGIKVAPIPGRSQSDLTARLLTSPTARQHRPRRSPSRRARLQRQ